MRRLNQTQLDAFINQNIMLSGSRERPGLMLTTANEIVKPFYRHKFISSRIFLSQAHRFAANSWKLLEKEIPAPVVKEIIYCPAYLAELQRQIFRRCLYWSLFDDMKKNQQVLTWEAVREQTDLLRTSLIGPISRLFSFNMSNICLK